MLADFSEPLLAIKKLVKQIDEEICSAKDRPAAMAHALEMSTEVTKLYGCLLAHVHGVAPYDTKLEAQ